MYHLLALAAETLVTDPALTIRVAILMIVAALLAGFAKAIGPDSARIPWNLSAPVRALSVALLAAVGNGIAAALTGDPLGISVLYAFATAAPSWGMLVWAALFSVADEKASPTGQDAAPALEAQKPSRPEIPPPTIPPAAALLLLMVLAAWIETACQGTLEETRPKAPLASLSIAGVPVLMTPGSPECLSLSRQRSLWKGLALSAGTLGLSGTAAALIELSQRSDGDKVNAETYAFLLGGGLFDAGAAFAAEQALGYGTDYVAAGCAGTPAP